jgi:hypothetical protein
MTTVARMVRGATSTGGVTAFVVRTRRAKHGARATEPIPPASTLDNDNRQETKP